MKIDQTLIFKGGDLNEYCKRLQILLDMKFEPHESYHYGDYYFGEIADTELRLCENIVFEGELLEPRAGADDVILYIGGAPDDVMSNTILDNCREAQLISRNTGQ